MKSFRITVKGAYVGTARGFDQDDALARFLAVLGFDDITEFAYESFAEISDIKLRESNGHDHDDSNLNL